MSESIEDLLASGAFTIDVYIELGAFEPTSTTAMRGGQDILRKDSPCTYALRQGNFE